MNNRELGARYEEEACKFLACLGMHVIARNFRTRYGEIDAIALDGRTLVFVEVKYRSTNRSGSALEAIGKAKQMQVRRMARQYLNYTKQGENRPMRFDCICITGEDFRYVRDAF